MSNPFSDSNNPYQSSAPVPSETFPPGSNREYALARVTAPAISLIVVAGIGLGWDVISIGLGIATGTGAFGPAPNLDPRQQAFATGQMVGAVLGDIVRIIMHIVIILGALKMKSLTGYGMAMTACILAVIPCCSPCFVIGVPFGIWGLVVLNDARVKSEFQ